MEQKRASRWRGARAKAAPQCRNRRRAWPQRGPPRRGRVGEAQGVGDGSELAAPPLPCPGLCGRSPAVALFASAVEVLLTLHTEAQGVCPHVGPSGPASTAATDVHLYPFSPSVCVPPSLRLSPSLQTRSTDFGHALWILFNLQSSQGCAAPCTACKRCGGRDALWTVCGLRSAACRERCMVDEMAVAWALWIFTRRPGAVAQPLRPARTPPR